MNVNCKLTLTDEERNAMHNRLTGTSTKKMVSRADVNTWVKDQLERFIKRGSPSTEFVCGSSETIPKSEPEEVRLTDEEFDNLEQGEIEYIIQQNKGLHSRVNRLQYMLDKRG